MDTATLKQVHPLYTQWAPVWRLLGDVYEGAGGFLDGSYLVPHPRELLYKTIKNADGSTTTDWTTVVGETPRYVRRKQMARYENFAAIVLDVIMAYLYAKSPARSIVGASKGEQHPLELWWQNVDGDGADIGDWMRHMHTLSALYGHTFIVMDRPESEAPPRTKAEQLSPFVRVYSPLDALDWIGGTPLRAVKFVEAVERQRLEDVIKVPAGTSVGDGSEQGVQYRVWDATRWTLYDQYGEATGAGDHQMGAPPVIICRGRPRATALGRVIGRSVLGDPRLYRDHYNLISEERAIERDQTFSVLNIPLKDDQTTDDAKAMAGDTVGTSSVLFTRLPAEYLAPPDAPLAHYREKIAATERKIYKLVGLPYDADSQQAETAESRRLKAMDLNRLLSQMAAEAERVEYELARLWFVAQDGPEAGNRNYSEAQLSIAYPTEFQTEEILDVIAELRAKLSAGLGPKANRLIRQRALPVILPDLTAEETAAVEEEIASTPVDAAGAATQFRQDLMQMTGQQQEPAAVVAEEE